MKIYNIYTKDIGGKSQFVLRFDEDVNQDNDEPLDTINDMLIEFFSLGLREFEEVTIDWCSEREVWITVG